MPSITYDYYSLHYDTVISVPEGTTVLGISPPPRVLSNRAAMIIEHHRISLTLPTYLTVPKGTQVLSVSFPTASDAPLAALLYPEEEEEPKSVRITFFTIQAGVEFGGDHGRIRIDDHNRGDLQGFTYLGTVEPRRHTPDIHHVFYRIFEN
jgi:hypothetical protein